MFVPDSSDPQYAKLVLHFLADLLKISLDAPTPEAFADRTRAYFDALRLWLDPADCPAPPRDQFTVLDYAAVPEDEAGDVWVRLSPEGHAFFRAWLRRQALIALEGW
jgi:hypothetical protein